MEKYLEFSHSFISYTLKPLFQYPIHRNAHSYGLFAEIKRLRNLQFSIKNT